MGLIYVAVDGKIRLKVGRGESAAAFENAQPGQKLEVLDYMCTVTSTHVEGENLWIQVTRD